MLSIQHAMYYILLNILFKKIVRFYVLELRLFFTLSKRCALKKKILYYADGNLINFVKNFTWFKLDAVIVSIVA